MKLITGVDLIEIDRLREAITKQGNRFLNRVFTPRELDENIQKVESLAGRFAAKEAVAKAFGCGIGEIAWKEIEILRTELGAPYLVLHGVADEKARDMGILDWSVSVSHTQSHAIAMVIGIKMD